MIRLIISIAGILLIFSSCEKDSDPPVPFSSFGISKVVADPYEDIYFYNQSHNATSFRWDFGDGYVATTINPSHYYAQPGSYVVTLTAFNRNYTDVSSVTIEVVSPPPTLLSIQVIEYYQRYPVGNASIIIYPTYTDWLNETNMITEAITNSEGVAIIEGLKPKQHYYLDVWETNHDNYILASENIKYITTPYLYYGTITYFTAFVDYRPAPQKRFKNMRPDNNFLNYQKTTASPRIYSDKLQYLKR